MATSIIFVFFASMILLLDKYVEALLFSSMKPIKADDIQASLTKYLDEEVSIDDVNHTLESIREKYAQDAYVFELKKLGGAYIFMTKTSYYPLIEQFLMHENKKSLSRTALETLAIIAYRQPVTKAEIESIRGVNSDYTVQKLLDADLITVAGRLDTPGKPLIFQTTDKFLNHFGLFSIKDLPDLTDVTGNTDGHVSIDEEQ